MKKLYEIKDRLCDELETYAGRDLSAGSLETIDKLAHAIKNIDKVIEYAEEQEYSETGSYNYGGSYARGGNQNGTRGGRMSRDGRSMMTDGRMSNAQRRDSRGRYSSEGGYSRTEDMVDELHELMAEAPEHTKGEFRKFIERIESMR